MLFLAVMDFTDFFFQVTLVDKNVDHEVLLYSDISLTPLIASNCNCRFDIFLGF